MLLPLIYFSHNNKKISVDQVVQPWDLSDFLTILELKSFIASASSDSLVYSAGEMDIEDQLEKKRAEIVTLQNILSIKTTELHRIEIRMKLRPWKVSKDRKH